MHLTDEVHVERRDGFMSRFALTTHSVMYARILGVLALVLGITGLVTNSADTGVSVFGFEPNTLQSLMHLLVGAVGLTIGFFLIRYARGYALIAGGMLFVLGCVGLVPGNTYDVGGLFGKIDGQDSFLYAAVGALGLIAWALSGTFRGNRNSKSHGLDSHGH